MVKLVFLLGQGHQEVVMSHAYGIHQLIFIPGGMTFRFWGESAPSHISCSTSREASDLMEIFQLKRQKPNRALGNLWVDEEQEQQPQAIVLSCWRNTFLQYVDMGFFEALYQAIRLRVEGVIHILLNTKSWSTCANVWLIHLGPRSVTTSLGIPTWLEKKVLL